MRKVKNQFKDVPMDTLFRLPNQGVFKKTHPCQGTHKDGTVRVVYPNDKAEIYTKHKGKSYIKEGLINV